MLAAKTLVLAVGLATVELIFPSATGGIGRAHEANAAATPALSRIVGQLVRDGAPGAVAAVRTGTEIRSSAGGLARRRPTVPMTAGVRFRVASLTKTFVATVVLQLVAEGKLRLDDSIERWLPGLVPGGGRITIQELLDHTSGLYDYSDDARFAEAVIADPLRAWPPHRLVAIATAHRPLFAPGRGWSYWNTNYVLLGLVIEAASRTPIEQQLQLRLFKPLHLVHTSFPRDPSISGRHAHGYIGFATLPRLRALVDATSALTPSVSWTAGAIVSTSDDVTAFYAALLDGRLLPPPLVAELKRPVPGARYGLGLMQAVTSCGLAYGHVGIAAGYRTVVYARADGSRVAVVMINVDGTYVTQSELEAAAETAFCSG